MNAELDVDCKEVSRLISQGLDQTLPARERARLRLHYVLCTSCRHVDEQMQFLRSAMRRLGSEEERRPDE